MSITITYAVDEILHFLEDIPLSANTVKYYSFCTAQEKRVQMGVICNTYALIMLKAARAIMISSLGCAKVIEELFQLEAL